MDNFKVLINFEIISKFWLIKNYRQWLGYDNLSRFKFGAHNWHRLKRAIGARDELAVRWWTDRRTDRQNTPKHCCCWLLTTGERESGSTASSVQQTIALASVLVVPLRECVLSDLSTDLHLSSTQPERCLKRSRIATLLCQRWVITTRCIYYRRPHSW